MLRLPSTLSAAEKTSRVDEIILELGLKDCANTLIGDEFVRGISGTSPLSSLFLLPLIYSSTCRWRKEEGQYCSPDANRSKYTPNHKLYISFLMASYFILIVMFFIYFMY